MNIERQANLGHSVVSSEPLTVRSEIAPELEAAVDLINHLRDKGVLVWRQGEQLFYRAPSGVITDEDVARLKACKRPLLFALEVNQEAERDDTSGRSTLFPYRAPLSFSQTAHWNLYQLANRASSCVLSLIFRIDGPVDIQKIRASVKAVVRRHSALRTQFVIRSGNPVQQICSPTYLKDDLCKLVDLKQNASSGAEVIMKMQRRSQCSIDMVTEPLFRVELLRFREFDHALIVLMEHSISDGYSTVVFTQELMRGYENVHSVGSEVLPLQFSEASNWQHRTLRLRQEEFGSYRKRHFAGCGRIKFPFQGGSLSAEASVWKIIHFRIPGPLKAELTDWSRRAGTTLVMSVFTAYAALVLRWCRVDDMVILYQTDGRSFYDAPDGIGYFAFPLYLRLKIRENDTLPNLLRQITAEYCQAYEHAEFSYSEAQVPRADFTRNTCFNWLPKGMDARPFTFGSREGTVEFVPVELKRDVLTNFERDTEPLVGFLETDNEITADITFPASRLSTESMEKFIKCLLVFMGALIHEPDRRVKDLPVS